MSMLSLPSFISPCYLLPTSYTHAVSNTHFPPSLFFFYWTFLNCHFFLFSPGFSTSECEKSRVSSCSNTDYTVCVERVHSFDFESVWRYILICVVHVYICASDVVNTLKHTTYFTTMTSSVVLSLLSVDVWFCERSPSNVLTSRMTYNLRKRIHQWCQSVNQPGKHQHQWGLN